VCRDLNTLQARRPSMTAPRSGRRRLAWAAAGASAAAVLLVTGLLWTFRTTRPGGGGGPVVARPGLDLPLTPHPGSGDGRDYWLPIESERTPVRSGGGADDPALQEAVRAYGRHDSRRVVELLEGRPISDYLKVMLASSLVWERRHAEARKLLESLDIETLPQ